MPTTSKHIFNPAELTNTIVYDESLPMIPDRATGYNKMGELDDYQHIDYW